MTLKGIVLSAVAAFICLAAVPATASAQATISGVAKDSSGAVLEGVRVEVASDVLIEKSRTVTTDGAGVYKVIDLRPGTYTVTFTCEGYQTVQREGLEVISDAVANANATMKEERLRD
jgi:hypothetical protein